MTNSLSWTEYINMKPDLAGYRIYLSVDGDPFELLADRPAGTSTYAHTGLEAGHTYDYFIRAYSISDQVTSSSCIRGLSSWQYHEPTENEFENASVENSDFVSLVLLPDTIATVPALTIYRSEYASGPFELLDEIQLQGTSPVYYDDLTAEVNSSSYYYYSGLVDSCGNEVLQTDLMRTIFLQGESSGAQENSLSWNAFEGWPAGVETYVIYRALDVDGSFEMLAEVDGLTLSYEDNFSNIPINANGLVYFVRAKDQGQTGLYSESNQILFEYSPSIYLPNAFTPGGQNPVYKPVGAFINFTEYQMYIYNRWGQLVFSSQDFSVGWDGSYKGQVAPTGAYVCLISYRSTEGSSGNLKSTFVLLR
jgi:gliding motility-associated-like protein